MRITRFFSILLVATIGCTQVKFEVGKRNEEKMLSNTGIVNALQESPVDKIVEPHVLSRVFGVHADSSTMLSDVAHQIEEEYMTGDITCRLGRFIGYDEVPIPFYELLPSDFKKQNKYPAIIMFSGHGDMEQVAFEKWTYQKGAALQLAKEGFVVYVMENRGMGKLSHLGDHLKIDAVARLTGGSWYGELITDGLYLINMVLRKSYVDPARIGAGGVSTGGALSLITAAIDHRISAIYVQGYLGSYKTTFGTRSNHHICNNIAGILQNFDMQDIAASIVPRAAMYVNGKRDTFYYQDAKAAFDYVDKRYLEQGYEGQASFASPENTIHELSTDLLIDFFNNKL